MASQINRASLKPLFTQTSIAAFLLYPREELLPESERLRTLSPDQFAATIVVNQEMPPVQLEFSALSDRARRG
jgi:hypothetical protein